MVKKKIKASKKSKVSKIKASKKGVRTKKSAKVVQPPVVVVPTVSVPAPVPVVSAPVPVFQKPEADQIWTEIKDLPISMFGLPNQRVHMHCSCHAVEPTKLYLLMRSSAALPALETALAPNFEVELADKFVIVRRAAKPLGTK